MEAASSMAIDPGRISGIVAEVLERLETDDAAGPGAGSAPLGVYRDRKSVV